VRIHAVTAEHQQLPADSSASRPGPAGLA
jgi:hypothetical protein